jgi:hypothetical protein
MTGVLLIAMGHVNYLKMAVNMAASLKASDKDVNIHLIHDGGLYNQPDNEQALFNSESVPADLVWHTKGQPDYIKPKTRMYDLSPFEKTLFLDVDMVWMCDRPVRQLFEELEGLDFTIMNEGPKDYCYWADPGELRQLVGGDNPMYIFYSELVYFEKTAKAKDYFKRVQKAFDKPKPGTKTFAGSAMPDELAFIMASLQTGIIPHKDNWLPIYWHFRDRKHRHLQPYQLSKLFYGYSIGGNVTPEYAKAHYNNLTAHYAKVMGINQPYQVRDKRSYIPERSKY